MVEPPCSMDRPGLPATDLRAEGEPMAAAGGDEGDLLAVLLAREERSSPLRAVSGPESDPCLLGRVPGSQICQPQAGAGRVVDGETLLRLARQKHRERQEQDKCGWIPSP